MSQHKGFSVKHTCRQTNRKCTHRCVLFDGGGTPLDESPVENRNGHSHSHAHALFAYTNTSKNRESHSKVSLTPLMVSSQICCRVERCLTGNL